MSRYVDYESEWIFNICFAQARLYSTRGEWKKSSPCAYEVALHNGWINLCCKHMIKARKWTKENCLASARQYMTRTEWLSNESGAYDAARRNQWLDECCEHMHTLRHFWTFDTCMESARNYKTRTEWQKARSGAYQAATKNGWLDDCCKHMGTPLAPRRARQKSSQMDSSKLRDPFLMLKRPHSVELQAFG